MRPDVSVITVLQAEALLRQATRRIQPACNP
jgi:hypothetical protein